jgi:calnexin
MDKKFTLFYVILVLFTFNPFRKTPFVLSDDLSSAGDDLSDTLANSDDSPDVGDSPPDVGDQSILYSTPNIDNYYIYEHFDDDQDFNSRWIRSEASKADSNEFKYDGEWSLTQTTSSLKGDSCLIVKSRARHHAISTKLDKVFKPTDAKPLVLQYEVQFRNGQECGGAYIKLL